MDSHKKTLAKTISWRVAATFITAFLAWGITGNRETGIAVGLADTFVKLIVYYGHERFWARIRLGDQDYVDVVHGKEVTGRDGEGI